MICPSRPSGHPNNLANQDQRNIRAAVIFNLHSSLWRSGISRFLCSSLLAVNLMPGEVKTNDSRNAMLVAEIPDAEPLNFSYIHQKHTELRLSMSGPVRYLSYVVTL